MSNYSIEEEKGRREPRWVSACLPVVIQGGDHVYNQREQCFLYGDQSIICLGEIPINLACVTIVCLVNVLYPKGDLVTDWLRLRAKRRRLVIYYDSVSVPPYITG